MHDEYIRKVTVCRGCGARLPDVEGPTHRYMASSPACWAAFGYILAREYSERQLDPVHRLSVDSYAVQHPGGRTPQSIQSVAVHLCRLCVVVESGLPPERANNAVLQVKRIGHRFRWLEPPGHLGEITVLEVLATEGLEAHAAAVRRWAQAAWFAWSKHHETIRGWLRAALVLAK